MLRRRLTATLSVRTRPPSTGSSLDYEHITRYALSFLVTVSDSHESFEPKDKPSGEPNYPSTIAGLKVTSVRDLTVGYDSANPPTYKPELPLSSGHMIQFRAESGVDDSKITLTTRCVVVSFMHSSPSVVARVKFGLMRRSLYRTSGTEPKIKYYLEGSGSDVARVREVLRKVVVELRDVWMEAEKNGLSTP